MFGILIVFFQNFFIWWEKIFTHQEKAPEIIEFFDENNKKVIIDSEKILFEDNLIEQTKIAEQNKNTLLFQCGKMKIYGTEHDILLLETEKMKVFYSENMAMGNDFSCENNILIDKNILPYKNPIFLKNTFTESEYIKEKCKQNGKKFYYFKNNELLKIADNFDKIPECENIIQWNFQ